MYFVKKKANLSFIFMGAPVETYDPSCATMTVPPSKSAQILKFYVHRVTRPIPLIDERAKRF